MDIQASGALTRTWNGTPISRRSTDGYVNATAMAKASGKQWSHYRETDRATTYMEALSRNTEIRVAELYVAKPGEGTWIHPRLAVDFARWISADFAVWMDAWFLEELQGRTTPEPKPALTLKPQETLDLIERSMGLLERLGVMDERDHLQFGDMVRNVTAHAAGGLLLPASHEDEELTISDAWLTLTGKPLPREKGPAIGKLVAALYREEFSAEPPTRIQYIDGAPRHVKSYKRGFLLSALDTVLAKLR